MKQFTFTQFLALTHCVNEMDRFLQRYADGKLEREFFINGMSGLIGYVRSVTNENGDYGLVRAQQKNMEAGQQHTTGQA
jgi:hypothetical protein